MASVVSRNIFDVLAGESTDPEAVKESEPSTKEQPVVVQKKVDRSRASPKEARIRHEYPQRGGHKPSASNRNNEDTRSGAPRDRNVGPRLAGRREDGGGGGGGGGDYHSTRTSRGARPNDRGRGGRGGRRGREYDRHSGSGRHDSEKKENQGWGKQTETWENNGATETSSWNAEATNDNNTNAPSSWGDNVEDTTSAGGNWGDTTTTTTTTTTTEEQSDWNAGVTVTEENNATNDAWNTTEDTGNSGWETQPEPTDNWTGGDEVKNEEPAANESAPAPEPEPEETQKTFDEYLAEKAQKSLDISLPEARKPNEGVDDSQWKDAVPLEKEEEDDFLFVGKEQSYRLKSKKAKAKTFVEITQTFEKPGGGSARGRGRGRGRGGGRGGRDDRDGRDRRDNNYRDNNYRDNNYRDNNYRDNNYDDNRDTRRRGGGGGGRSIVNLDDQSAFPSLTSS